MKLDLRMLERQAAEIDGSFCARLSDARSQVTALLESVRNLSQLLRPSILDDLGLIPAMRSYVERFQARSQIRVSISTPETETRLPPPLEVALYRGLQEALTNIVRHAEASQVDLSLRIGDDAVTLRIEDNGVGFDAAAFLHQPPADHGMGLIGMQERVASHGGTLGIDSRPGNGTRLTLSVPLTGGDANSHAAFNEADGHV